MSLENSPSSSDRVLVTGATSYLGSRFVRRLLSEQHEVHVIVRPTSDRGRLGLPADNLTVHEYNGSIDSLLTIMNESRPDVVVHLATQYLRDHDPDQVDALVGANILFGVQLLEAMRQTEVKRLINPTTFFQFFDSTGYRPVNLYAATKQAFQDILAYYVDAHGFEATTLVLYDVYGPGDWRQKLMAAIIAAQNNGSSLPLVSPDMIMDLVYVSDVVDAFVHAMNAGITGGPYAVSSGQRHTLRDIVGAFEEVGNRQIDCKWDAFAVPSRNPTEPWNGPALPGWQAKVSLNDGVQQFLNQEAAYEN